MNTFTQIASPLGILTLRGTERGLTGIFMEDHRHGPSVKIEPSMNFGPNVGFGPGVDFGEARTQLSEYFAGKREVFTVPIDRDAMGGTPFQRRVWAALEAIPFGVTISYGELARRIDQPAAVRAVGLANGRNPLSIIVPCHRVIGANGTLTGYGGGLERKRFLLELEKGLGVRVA
jgi:O-6-methylguanine DNA methyltransferase